MTKKMEKSRGGSILGSVRSDPLKQKIPRKIKSGADLPPPPVQKWGMNSMNKGFWNYQTISLVFKRFNITQILAYIT